ncbi:MAG: response regulator [Elusimicrobia bacterium]|nr:response regulator [Elusimicrobiota bacterium]
MSPLAKPEEKLVLVVDDDPGIVGLFTEAIRIEGFRVAAAKDGEEALEQVEKLKPDMILLDLMLPDYGGFEVIQELKSGPAGKTPIVVISGRFTDKETSSRLKREPSVVAFLDKPVKPMELVTLLHDTLGTEPRKKR